MISNRDLEVSNAGAAEVDMKGAGEAVATMEEVEEEEDTTTGVVEVEAVVEVEEVEEVVADITHPATRAIAARRKLRCSLLNAG